MSTSSSTVEPRRGHVSILVICLVAISLTACAERQHAARETAKAQTRINAYFHGDVVPKLKACWGKVQGDGVITIAHDYETAGGAWVPSGLDVHESTLPLGQDQVALDCMETAVAGTSFPVDGTEAPAEGHSLFWSWPVPLPTETVALKAPDRPSTEGIPCFSDCSFQTDPPRCIFTFFGWKGCRVDGSLCTVVLKRCTVGGLYSPIGKFAK